MTGKVGQPTKLTPARADKLIDGIKLGLFDAQNALRVGIDFVTLRSWVDRGLDEEADEPYKSFAERYLKATIELEESVIGTILAASDEYKRELHSVETWDGPPPGDGEDFSSLRGARKVKEVQQHMRGDWKAAAWYAERRWPLRWGITRQPEGGPKEALKLPDAPLVRRRKVAQMVNAPPPELIKAFREAGYELVRREKGP